jgi:hypothetical protein
MSLMRTKATRGPRIVFTDRTKSVHGRDILMGHLPGRLRCIRVIPRWGRDGAVDREVCPDAMRGTIEIRQACLIGDDVGVCIAHTRGIATVSGVEMRRHMVGNGTGGRGGTNTAEVTVRLTRAREMSRQRSRHEAVRGHRRMTAQGRAVHVTLRTVAIDTLPEQIVVARRRVDGGIHRTLGIFNC